MTSRHPAPVAVQIPTQRGDRPSWIKVGVIAAVGFVIGVAWPRLAGIRPGPSAPSEAASAAPAAAHVAEGPLAAAPSAETSVAPAPAPAPAPATSMKPAPPAVLVTRGAVLTCKTQDGEALKGNAACGGLAGFDLLAQPRLKRLAQCPAAADASGKIAVVFNVDFVRNHVGFDFGRTTTIENKDSVVQCLRSAMEKVSLNAVEHEHPLYAVFYSVTFTPREKGDAVLPVVATPGAPQLVPNSGGTPGAPAAPVASGAGAPREASPASNEAQVGWEVAIVRDTPRTGAVIGRLQRGTKVRVGAGQEGWFRVQYGNNFASEGWVYRGAIGK